MNLRNDESSSAETEKKQIIGCSWQCRITSSTVILLILALAFVAILIPFLILHIVVYNEASHQEADDVYLRNLRTHSQPQRPANNLDVQSDFLATQKKDWDPSNSNSAGKLLDDCLLHEVKCKILTVSSLNTLMMIFVHK